MTRPILARSSGSTGESDDEAPLLRIDAAVFESLSLRRPRDAEGATPAILRWFEAWAGVSE